MSVAKQQGVISVLPAGKPRNEPGATGARKKLKLSLEGSQC